MTSPLTAWYDALAAGQLATAAQSLTEDTVLHVPGRSSNTGTYTGRDAVVGFVAHAAEVTGGTLDLTVHRVLDDGEWGVALCTYTATRPDREVLTDNGPEFTGRAFADHVADIGITHHRIPPRSPNHNSVCERVQGTVLQEFYRPFFHRGRVDRIADLDAALQTWVTDYNTRRRNHGDYMRGRNPRQVLDAITARDALCQAA